MYEQTNQKDICIFLSVALLHVLAMHARVLVTWPVHHVWQQLAIPLIEEPTSSFALTPREREVPLLLRDPTAMLIQFILLLPLHLDQSMCMFQHYISNNFDFSLTLTLWHLLIKILIPEILHYNYICSLLLYIIYYKSKWLYISFYWTICRNRLRGHRNIIEQQIN